MIIYDVLGASQVTSAASACRAHWGRMALSCALQGAPCLQQMCTSLYLVQVQGCSVQMATMRCCAAQGHGSATPMSVQQEIINRRLHVGTALLTRDAITHRALVALEGLGTDTACETG